MYEDIVISLRHCAENDCSPECPRAGIGKGCISGLKREAADAIEELSAIREEQKAQIIAMAAEGKPRWIPVTKRLPVGGDDSGSVCENVCLLMDDGTVSCGWMNGITKKVYYLNARDDVVIKAPITRVTHWMPLPQPPKEE